MPLGAEREGHLGATISRPSVSPTMIRHRAATIALVMAALIASPAAARCGHERWSVKTGTDFGAAGIDIQRPAPTTIAALSAFAQPSLRSNTPDSRISPGEVTAWTLQAAQVEFKFKDSPNTRDSDSDLVLRDSQDSTLIAVTPSPSWVGHSSLFADGIRHARQEIDARFPPITHARSSGITP